ncbi:MAG: hypothetical protein LBH25_01950 [Fibromonadaceae bacterium]|nr:hypothetical protein [Fibromonadaceae bacterium]
MEQISTLVKSKRVNSLLTEARQLTGVSKKVNLIEMALEHLIKYKKRLNLISMAGNISFDVDLDATRGRK